MAYKPKEVTWLSDAAEMIKSGVGWPQVVKLLVAKGHDKVSYFKVRARFDEEYKQRFLAASRRSKMLSPNSRLRENAIDDLTVAKVIGMIKAGYSRRSICRTLNIARSTLKRRFPPHLNGEYLPTEADRRREYVLKEIEALAFLPPPPPKERPKVAKKQPRPPKPPKAKPVEPIRPRFIEAERIVVEEKDVRATTYVRRNYKFGMPIQRQPRIRNVTGSLLGDPGHPSMRVATNQRSHAE